MMTMCNGSAWQSIYEEIVEIVTQRFSDSLVQSRKSKHFLGEAGRAHCQDVQVRSFPSP